MKPSRKCTWVFTPNQGVNDFWIAECRLVKSLDDELSRIWLWFWNMILRRNLRNAWKELTKWK